jgi:hypothetical protein
MEIATKAFARILSLTSILFLVLGFMPNHVAYALSANDTYTIGFDQTALTGSDSSLGLSTTASTDSRGTLPVKVAGLPAPQQTGTLLSAVTVGTYDPYLTGVDATDRRAEPAKKFEATIQLLKFLFQRTSPGYTGQLRRLFLNSGAYSRYKGFEGQSIFGSSSLTP